MKGERETYRTIYIYLDIINNDVINNDNCRKYCTAMKSLLFCYISEQVNHPTSITKNVLHLVH